MNPKQKPLWIVTSAWPTINNVPHLGTILQLLSADVISRYLRLVGEEVISVSGSDVHGTPILLSAENNHQTPGEFSESTHKKIVQLLGKWNICLDNYTITSSEYHKNFVQIYYKTLQDNKTIFSQVIEQFYCEKDQLFLPDRFVEGTCPKCRTKGARGDQCAKSDCNAILIPEILIDPICKKCGSSPVLKKTEHKYLDLKLFENKLKSFIKNSRNFSSLVVNESLKFFNPELQPRAVTRDLSWGIDASFLFNGNHSKVFYVWSEDVLGYLSASAEYIEKNFQRSWKDVWKDPVTKTVFCLGLDNIFFHAIWFPALLLASNENFVLPTFLSTTQFLQFNGKAFSKSKNIGLWIDEALNLAPADVWRFYLIYTRPEKKSVNFEWHSFVKIINKDLITNVFNLVHRISSLLWKYTKGKIDLPITLQKRENRSFVKSFQESIDSIRSFISQTDIKGSFHESLNLNREINAHLSKQAPWKKLNLQEQYEDVLLCYCSTVIVLNFLKPVIPTFSNQLLKQLNAKNLNILIENENILTILLKASITLQLPKPIKLLVPLSENSLLSQYNSLKKS